MSIVYDFNALNDNLNTLRTGTNKTLDTPKKGANPHLASDVGMITSDIPVAVEPQMETVVSPIQDTRSPKAIRELIHAINDILRTRSSDKALCWNVDDTKFKYRGKEYSIETLFDGQGGVALIDPPAYLKFENGQWIDVMSSGNSKPSATTGSGAIAGYKTLANGDIQHESIGRNPYEKYGVVQQSYEELVKLQQEQQREYAKYIQTYATRSYEIKDV